MRVLGLNVQGGLLNIGVVASEGDGVTRVDGAPERLQPSKNLEQSARLHDLADRFRQMLREVRPDEVVIVSTRKYAQWKYSDAYDRVALVVIAMLQCEAEKIPCREIKTEDIGKAVTCPAHMLETFDHVKVGFSTRPTYWTTGRAEAFAAAYAATGGV